jgi:hypothetical protein
MLLATRTRSSVVSPRNTKFSTTPAILAFARNADASGRTLSVACAPSGNVQDRRDLSNSVISAAAPFAVQASLNEIRFADEAGDETRRAV